MDGSWWGILFTVPNMEKTQRHSIRKKLLAYRFTSLYPGFWISPLHPKEKIDIHLESLINNEYCTLIRFDFFCEITKEEISRIWRIDEVMHSFETIIEIVREHLDRASGYTPVEGLKYKLLVGNEIVNALFADLEIKQILCNKGEDGLYRCITNIPKHFGGTGEGRSF